MGQKRDSGKWRGWPAKICQYEAANGNWPTYVMSSADTSFRVTLRHAAILGYRTQQLAERCNAKASLAIEVSNFKRNSPLLKQHTIGTNKTHFRIVDVSGFGGDAIQFDDVNVATCHEVLTRWHANVKASEEKAFKALGNL